jgi:hypothetical protein
VSNGVQKQRPRTTYRLRPDAPLAQRRPGYPLSGCFPAEPDSVSPGGQSARRQGEFCNHHWTPELCLQNPTPPSLIWCAST